MCEFAPIVLLVYNRAELLRTTLKHLQDNVGACNHELYVFCDGPKNGADALIQQEIYSIIDSIEGFKNINIFKRKVNVGLYLNVIESVNYVLSVYDSVIVLEDDLITSRYFLQYMNDGLCRFADDDHVGMIHGHIYDIDGLPERFFVTKSGCLGWGTWGRVWKNTVFNPKMLLNQIYKNKLESKFDLNGSFPYTKMLRNRVLGKNNSWAVCFYASLFLNNMLTFYPGRSLVKHVGFNSGTHCINHSYSPLDGTINTSFVKSLSVEVVNNDFALSKIENLYRSLQPSLVSRAFESLKRRIKMK